MENKYNFFRLDGWKFGAFRSLYRDTGGQMSICVALDNVNVVIIDVYPYLVLPIHFLVYFIDISEQLFKMHERDFKTI